MKRAQLIQKLMSEGFSEKTLVNFNDKQLEKFANKVLKEAQTVTTTKTVYNSKDPKDVAALNTALKDPNVNKNDIEVKEDEVIPVGKIKKSKKVKPVFKNLNEFVENTVNSNYHSLVTKGDMVSLVKEKINESSELEEKGMPKIPEFMSFDSIVSAGEKEAPEKDAPDVDAPPREKPGVDRPEKDPRRSPFRNPEENPVVNPDPKAKIKKMTSMKMAAE
jgi:hypothetical protein